MGNSLRKGSIRKIIFDGKFNCCLHCHVNQSASEFDQSESIGKFDCCARINQSDSFVRGGEIPRETFRYERPFTASFQSVGGESVVFTGRTKSKQLLRNTKIN